MIIKSCEIVVPVLKFRSKKLTHVITVLARRRRGIRSIVIFIVL